MSRSSAVFSWALAFLLSTSPSGLWAAHQFQAAESYGSGGVNTFSVAVADLNGDGKLDIVTASQCTIGGRCNYNEGDDGRIGVLLGNGDGTFQPARGYYSGGGTAYSVVVGDVNSDGKMDIVVVNACVGFNNCDSGSVGVLLGNGDGTFQQAVSYSSGGYQPLPIALADVNGDRKLDIVVGNACVTFGNCVNSSASLLLGNGDGTFQPPVTFDPGGSTPAAIAVTDLNGDGHPDLLIALRCLYETDCSGGMSVFMGNGDGTFQTPVVYDTGGAVASAIRIEDIDADGKLDAIVANGDISRDENQMGNIAVFRGNGDGTFQVPALYDSGGFDSLTVAVADVNGDSIPDLVSAAVCRFNEHQHCGPGSLVGVLFGNGDGTFQPPVLTYYSGGQEPQQIVVGDVDGDGRPDLVVANQCQAPGLCSNGSAGVLLNIGKFETTTSVASNLNPAVYGQAVNLTAQINSVGKPVPTGKVKFLSDGTLLGSATVSGNMATLTSTSLPVGALSIAATYEGDKDSGQSVSAALSEVVQQASTTTTLKASPNPSSSGQAVKLTAKVASSTAKVKGAVTFTVGAMTLGTVTLIAGSASLTTTALPPGTDTITATYNGTADVAGSVASVSQVVN